MQKNLKNLLLEHKVTLKKAYGQNFLTDENLLKDIVNKAGVTKSDTVLEIGCGAGALTSVLAESAKKVVGYEIDKTLKPLLNEVLADYNNVDIVFNDVLKESLDGIEKKLADDYVVVANLPYYITTPIVMKFIEGAKRVKSLVIMVQEEVANRFSASPSSPDYGAITVGINLRGSAKTVLYVGREKFTPVPNVDSAVVKIDIDKDKNKDIDFSKVRDIVRCAFSSRRKMLVNNIMNFYKLSRNEVEEILNSANIPLTARGETLSAEQFIILSNRLNGKNNG